MARFPLRLFPYDMRFDFMGKRWFGFSFSALMTVIALGLILTKGLNLGIDFTGGVLMEVRTPVAADIGKMRESLSHHDFGEVSLQNFGSDQDVIVRLQTSSEEEQAVVVAKVKEILSTEISPDMEYRRIDYVGPTVGKELIRAGTVAVILSFLTIMAYVWFRFEWQYGVGAILALLHDTIMMVGFFAVTRYEFGLTALAAVLTMIGYSINDSVVIYDRIRENMRRYKKISISELLNISINETLARTFLTASTVLLASLALALKGGEVLEGFAWAMVFGTLVGTYSSIYISAPLLIYLNLRDTASPEESSAAAKGGAA